MPLRATEEYQGTSFSAKSALNGDLLSERVTVFLKYLTTCLFSLTKRLPTHSLVGLYSKFYPRAAKPRQLSRLLCGYLDSNHRTVYIVWYGSEV